MNLALHFGLRLSSRRSNHCSITERWVSFRSLPLSMNEWGVVLFAEDFSAHWESLVHRHIHSVVNGVASAANIYCCCWRLLGFVVLSSTEVSLAEKCCLSVTQDPVCFDFRLLVVLRLEQPRILGDLWCEETLRRLQTFFLLAFPFLFKLFFLRVHAGQLLQAKLVVRILKVLDKAPICFLRISLRPEGHCLLRVRDARKTERNELVVCVDLGFRRSDQVFYHWGPTSVLNRFWLGLKTSIEEVVVWKQLVLQLIHSDDVFVGDETCHAPLLHVFHSLSLSQVSFVLNDVRDVLGDRFVSHWVVLDRVLFSFFLLLYRPLDRLNVWNSHFPFFFLAC